MEIIEDIANGFFDSIRLDIYIRHIYDSDRYLKIIKKLFKYNILLHIIPAFIVDLINYLFQISLQVLLYYINYPIMLFSIFIHTLIYIELTSALSSVTKNRKIKSDGTFIDSITIIIMMTIYQLVVYLSNKIISMILADNLYICGLIINFVILIIYHSLYTYNNLWQVIGLNITHRISIYEARWAYFLGYVLIITSIYVYTVNAYILAIYNIYMAMLLSIPLLRDFDFRTDPKYFKIDLSFFSFIIKQIFNLSKKLVS